MRLLKILSAAVAVLIIGAAFAAVFLLAMPARAEVIQAQAVCGPHGDVVRKLEGDYKEARAGLGLAANGGLVELFVGEGGSWSVLVTRPDGISCLVAAGQNWEIVKPNYGEDGEQS